MSDRQRKVKNEKEEREEHRETERKWLSQRETHTETWTEANGADKLSGQTDSTPREINSLGPPDSTPEEA